MRPGVAVLASRVRTDERRIFEALERHSISYTHLDTRTLWTLPAARREWTVVLNREISYFRAVYAARTMEAHGNLVVNNAAATELCGDKWRTTLALVTAGVPTPPAALGMTPQAALAALDEIGYPAVVKPLVGSWGRLVAPLPDRAAAESLLEYVAAMPGAQSHVVYVQRMVDKPGRDIRAAVIGGEVVGASYRRADEWRTNVARGGMSQYCVVTRELGRLAARAAEVTNAQVAGVDLIEDRDGQLLVLEVNHGLEFTGLQRALGRRLDIADRMVDHLRGWAARRD